MTDIYKQHESAFARVSAYCVLRDGLRVANIAFKYPRDGAGRLYAYVHWVGLEMVRGQASGYGYDKRSAACASAVSKIQEPSAEKYTCKRDKPSRELFVAALAQDNGTTWVSQLRDAGFTVFQAV